MMQTFRTEGNYRSADRLSPAELRTAIASREILQSTALAFDTQRQLRFDLGGVKAVMPFGQCADGAESGTVRVGGVDVRDYNLDVLRREVSMVLQKNVLFSGTILDNLRWGDENASDQEIEAACRLACADEFIERFPDKYQTHIEQGGTNVSGGQKQRLSIARAIAKDPKIYLFDDSFSALDYKTDVTLRRALKEETDNATVIIVAQRISTVLHANQILVLDDGRLVGKGTHAQLMATCPEYQEIARSQLSQKELNLQDLNTGKEDE